MTTGAVSVDVVEPEQPLATRHPRGPKVAKAAPPRITLAPGELCVWNMEYWGPRIGQDHTAPSGIVWVLIDAAEDRLLFKLKE